MTNQDLSFPPQSQKEYRKFWEQLGKLEITMIEKKGKCPHNVGDKYIFDHPYKRPEGVCYALLHVIELYTWRCALGFPSWEADDRTMFRIHCPSKKGTVWELRKADAAV